MTRRKHFEIFGPHTRLKQAVFGTYLEAWASILLQRFPKVWLIDAFAGEGQDLEGNPGSPLIACKIAKKIRSSVSLVRGKSVEFTVVAIESSKTRAKRLSENLAEFTGENGCARVIRGLAGDEVTKLLIEADRDPVLLFVDPFGVKGISADMLSSLLRIPHREALILFHDTGANRLHASSTTKLRRGPDLSLDMFSDTASESAVENEAVEVIEARENEWQKDHEEILRNAFGDMWPIVKEELSRTHPRRRRKLLVDRFMERVRQSGAIYVIRTSIQDDEGKHHYYLVHASTHPRAHYVMKKAIDKAMRDREANPSLLPGMAFFSEANLGEVVKRIAARFAGQQPRWHDDENEEDSVQFFAFAETDALLSDRDQLLELLKGYEISRKPRTYRFPAVN